MDTNTSFNLERAETQTCTRSMEPSPVLAHSSSLKEVNGQLPLPATVTVSSDLVEDLLVQLMLGLNPLKSAIGAHLDQQELLTLCLHMSIETLDTLKKVPGVIVDEHLPPPCNTWKAAVLLQSSLMKRFGTPIQVRKQLMRNDPELLNFIPHHVTEAVLTTHKAESAGESTPSQTPSDEESQLFSQFLPETTKEEMFEQYGSWIRKNKIFQRAFLNEDILECQRHISEPHLSNRYAVDCNNIVAWSLIVTQMLNQLRTPLRFEEETDSGDESPDSFDTPDSREEIEPESEPTKLELPLQEELFPAETVTEPQPEKKTKKNNKFFPWLSKLARCRKP